MEATPHSIILRGAHLEDAPTLLAWELQPELQNVTTAESSVTLDFIYRHILSSMNLLTDLQQRFIIERNKLSIGTIDLYDYADSSASVGIFIDKSHRQQGYAIEALRQIIEYSRTLGLKSLNAEVHSTNKACITLFRKAGFRPIDNNQSEDIISLQLRLDE